MTGEVGVYTGPSTDRCLRFHAEAMSSSQRAQQGNFYYCLIVPEETLRLRALDLTCNWNANVSVTSFLSPSPAEEEAPLRIRGQTGVLFGFSYHTAKPRHHVCSCKLWLQTQESEVRLRWFQIQLYHVPAYCLASMTSHLIKGLTVMSARREEQERSHVRWAKVPTQSLQDFVLFIVTCHEIKSYSILQSHFCNIPLLDSHFMDINIHERI